MFVSRYWKQSICSHHWIYEITAKSFPTEHIHRVFCTKCSKERWVGENAMIVIKTEDIIVIQDVHHRKSNNE